MLYTSTISWNREAVTTLNVIVINFHTWLSANLHNLVFQLIIWYIIWNITKFYIVPSAIWFQFGLVFCQVNHSFKWQQRDSNPQPLSSYTNIQPFSQTGQMIELCCDYLCVWCIWLYVIIMSCMILRVNLHSIVCLNVKKLLAWSRYHI